AWGPRGGRTGSRGGSWRAPGRAAHARWRRQARGAAACHASARPAAGAGRWARGGALTAGRGRDPVQPLAYLSPSHHFFPYAFIFNRISNPISSASSPFLALQFLAPVLPNFFHQTSI